MEDLKLGDQYSVAEVLKYLSRAPFTSLMKLFDRVKGDNLEARILGLAADPDFAQSVLDLVSSKEELNPALKAVAEAFKRRALSGSFVSDTHCVALDALRYADTRGDNDQDGLATDIKSLYDKNKKLQRGDKSTPNICWPYQRGMQVKVLSLCPHLLALWSTRTREYLLWKEVFATEVGGPDAGYHLEGGSTSKPPA